VGLIHEINGASKQFKEDLTIKAFKDPKDFSQIVDLHPTTVGRSSKIEDF
jgi:hypothetical protein